MRGFLWPLAAAGVLGVSACTGGGPRTDAIVNAENAIYVSSDAQDPFFLVDLTQATAHAVSLTMKPAYSWLPPSAEQPFVIGRGDILEIAIISNNDEGYIDFAQSAVTPLSTVQLPLQEVGTDGRVAVPTVGRVRASGYTVAQFEQRLTNFLAAELVSPTAVVRLAERNSARAAVIGEVSVPGDYPLIPTSNHVLELIGEAGGPTRKASDLIVSLSRHGKSYSARLSDIYEDAALNVHVRRDDVISVEPNLTRVQVLGATFINTQLEFETVDVDLMDVLSEAGGLINTRAALKGVFVYRHAPSTQLYAVGAPVEKCPSGKTIPTVFRLDMTEPTSLFAGSHFKMMDGDIVYVSDNLNAQVSAIVGSVTTFVPAPVEYIRDAEFGTP